MLFDVGNWLSESCLPGSPGIPRNPPGDKQVHPAADMSGSGTRFAVRRSKGAFPPRNADVVRLVLPGGKFPVADTDTAVAAASFRIENVSISSTSMSFILRGTPSTSTSGSVPPAYELIPRIKN